MTDDDVMVCQCQPSASGEACHTPACLNRVLNIECIDDHCPCGAAMQFDGVSKCRNQQFQRREGVRLNKLRCGAKGWGLCAEQDVVKGQFITEYCGEVLEESTCVPPPPAHHTAPVHAYRCPAPRERETTRR
jgi:hypothetical protein